MHIHPYSPVSRWVLDRRGIPSTDNDHPGHVRLPCWFCSQVINEWSNSLIRSECLSMGETSNFNPGSLRDVKTRGICSFDENERQSFIAELYQLTLAEWGSLLHGGEENL
ncbi:hypothetical protein E1B28_002818 [Marasmius oreades]|uniref:Uncharacterized protein n=1 Tax=Marasmius oreades TaxID=181124 RepID=A0A9P7UPB8_9AGAR|nr:uncharacterized protein E1B28_002818 [Marasmius oreades]KAG7086899.1 hypothetical protein E1B28_002818 [Marasmius oreades]